MSTAVAHGAFLVPASILNNTRGALLLGSFIAAMYVFLTLHGGVPSKLLNGFQIVWLYDTAVYSLAPTLFEQTSKFQVLCTTRLDFYGYH